jgi:hypothetical protein
MIGEMRLPRAPLAALVLTLAVAPAAHAGPFELHADLRVGAATGFGIGGDQKNRDFFDQSKGGVYGLLVGARFLIVEVSVEHDQFTDFQSVKGTWTEFCAGIGGEIGVDEPLKGEANRFLVTFGLDLGFGLGTGRQVMPPLDNAQISDKGVMADFHIGIEYRFAKIFALAAEVPVGWGYMFKNDVPVNDTSNHYQTFHAMGLGVLKVRVGL